jgi:predicted dehydrogenase
MVPGQDAVPLRLAIVGAGIMGRNHLRAARVADVAVVGITDINPAQAHTAAAEFACAALNDLAAVDAAIIAVPTAAHASVALQLLQRGVHCLVEKPFAATETDCGRLIEAAVVAGAVLQIGHVERFNPAMEALAAHAIDPASITTLSARRMGPASARVTDVSVVVDLMVHDLDAALSLKPMAVAKVDATGNRDHAEAELTFADGTIATLTASRIATNRVRDLAIGTRDGSYHVDFLAKTLALPRQNPTVFSGDALAAQLKHFMACIATHSPPRVTGETGRDVMKLAWRIEAALGLNA